MDVKSCTGAASVLKEVTRNPIGGNARCSAVACKRRRMRATGPYKASLTVTNSSHCMRCRLARRPWSFTDADKHKALGELSRSLKRSRT